MGHQTVFSGSTPEFLQEDSSARQRGDQSLPSPMCAVKGHRISPARLPVIRWQLGPNKWPSNTLSRHIPSQQLSVVWASRGKPQTPPHVDLPAIVFCQRRQGRKKIHNF